MKLYKCSVCGQIITKVKNSGMTPMCCGRYMEEIIPQETESIKGSEKHIPAYVLNDNILDVCIGSIPHPMIDIHYIEWIAVETDKGVQFRKLTPDCEPRARFILEDEERPLAIYCYCNIHSFWKIDLYK